MPFLQRGVLGLLFSWASLPLRAQEAHGKVKAKLVRVVEGLGCCGRRCKIRWNVLLTATTAITARAAAAASVALLLSRR